MKKLVAAAATVALAAAMVVGVASADRGGTLVDSGFACGILDGNGSAFITTNSELWVYQTKAVLKCSGNGAPAASLTYFNYGNTGISCGMLQYGSTTDWVDKVGYNGNSQLTCTRHLDGDRRLERGGVGIG